MMSIKSELTAIELELNLIKESTARINTYNQELNNFNPFKVGEELIGNDYSHNGKKFIVESTYVSNRDSAIFRVTPYPTMPVYFIAKGKVIKKDGSKGTYETIRSIKISDVVSEGE